MDSPDYADLPAGSLTTTAPSAFAFLSLLVGAVLRVGGYISESGLLAVWKAGFKAVTSFKRESTKLKGNWTIQKPTPLGTYFLSSRHLAASRATMLLRCYEQ